MYIIRSRSSRRLDDRRKARIGKVLDQYDVRQAHREWIPSKVDDDIEILIVYSLCADCAPRIASELRACGLWTTVAIERHI